MVNHNKLVDDTASLSLNYVSFTKEKVYKNRSACKNAVT